MIIQKRGIRKPAHPIALQGVRKRGPEGLPELDPDQDRYRAPSMAGGKGASHRARQSLDRLGDPSFRGLQLGLEFGRSPVQDAFCIHCSEVAPRCGKAFAGEDELRGASRRLLAGGEHEKRVAQGGNRWKWDVRVVVSG